MDNDQVDTNLGISRRDLLRRGAIVGGTLVWAAPAVQTFAKPAFAQVASPACFFQIVSPNGTVFNCSANQACCDCLDSGDTTCFNDGRECADPDDFECVVVP